MRSFGSALVTGATGFIGSALVARLAAEQVNVTCLVRHSKGFQAFDNLKNVRVIEVPSFQTSCLKEHLSNISADVVFNLASYGVQQEDRDPDELIEGNVRSLTWWRSGHSRDSSTPAVAPSTGCLRAKVYLSRNHSGCIRYRFTAPQKQRRGSWGPHTHRN